MSYFTTTFAGGDESPLSEGGKWEGPYDAAGNLQNVAHSCEPAVLATNGWMAVNVLTFGHNQYAEAVIGANAGAVFNSAGLVLRSTALGVPIFMYQFVWRLNDANSTLINKYVNDVGFLLASNNTVVWGPGDVFRAEVIDGTGTNNLAVYRNGSSTPVLSTTDSTVNINGRIGITQYVDTGGSLADSKITSFQGGDLYVTAKSDFQNYPKFFMQPIITEGRLL